MLRLIKESMENKRKKNVRIIQSEIKYYHG